LSVVSNAMREPSGDHRGLESGPSSVTSGCTRLSETVTIEMFAVPRFAGSLLMR